MPNARRKAPPSAVPAKKPAKPAAVPAKRSRTAPAKGKPAPGGSPKPPFRAPEAPAGKRVPARAPAPVRPLMKLGREDLAAFRWAGRARGVPAERPAAPVTGLDAGTAFSRVVVRDGFPSPLAPPRPDGKVATGLRGTAAVSAAFAPSADRPCAACLARPCACAAALPGARKGSPYEESGPAPVRVTSWRRWP